VYDEDKKEYLGFLDVRDLVSWVVFVYDEQKVKDNSRLADLIQHGSGQFKMSGTEGVTITYLSRRHRFHSCDVSSPLTTVVKLLADNAIHRVPIVKDGKVINIASQTTIMKAITKHIPDLVFDHSDDLSIGELGVATRQVLSVTKDSTVIDTFREMDRKQRSGIALTDPETGMIVGTTTGKDLGLFIKNPTLGALQEPIFNYLKSVRCQQIDIKSPLITVMESDKLTRAVGLLSSTGVHRVFIVNNQNDLQPVGVLSITDVLKFFCH